MSYPLGPGVVGDVLPVLPDRRVTPTVDRLRWLSELERRVCAGELFFAEPGLTGRRCSKRTQERIGSAARAAGIAALPRPSAARVAHGKRRPDWFRSRAPVVQKRPRSG